MISEKKRFSQPQFHFNNVLFVPTSAGNSICNERLQHQEKVQMESEINRSEI